MKGKQSYERWEDICTVGLGRIAGVEKLFCKNKKTS